jgi:hypothetical protein
VVSDFALLLGRRFRFGTIGDQNVVMVMTGLSMVINSISILFFDMDKDERQQMIDRYMNRAHTLWHACSLMQG